MNHWTLILGLFMITNQTIENTPPLSIDFGSDKDGNNWYVVTDRVMGGVSTSSIKMSKNSLIFSGTVSLKNNGGFASIRSSQQSIDLSKYKQVLIRFKTSELNRTFALRLNTNTVYYRPSYNQSFKAKTKDWQTLSFKLIDFKETILGKSTKKTIPLEKLKNVLRIGIMLNDKKEGRFSLEIDSIHFQ